MKKLLLVALLWCGAFLPTVLLAQTYSWNGTTSSNWNTATNWTPNGIPGSGNTVNITNASAPNMPTLAGNISLTSLTLNGTSLNLAGYSIAASATANFTNSMVTNGSISALNFSTVTGSAFTGGVTLTKTGGTSNIWAGGNTFQNFTLINNDNSYIRLANTASDTYSGSTRFATTSGYIEVSYANNSSFNGNVTIDASGTNGVRFGQNGGVSTIASGYSLLTNGYTSTQLILKNVVQNGSVANGSFAPVNFSSTSCSFSGNFTVNASGAITIVSSQFSRTNNFTAINYTNVSLSTFSSATGTTFFDKTAGVSNTWSGGNTFYNTTIQNNSTNLTVTLANTTDDNFYGTTVFSAQGGNRINIGHVKNAAFNGNVYLNNSSTAGIYIGANGGSASIASGYSLLTSGFAGGVLSLNRVTQSGSTSNGTFSPTTFVANTCSFGGNFTMTNATTATITSSTFSRTNVFSATNTSGLSGSSFSALGGTTTITKLGGATETWTGGNTFANCTFNNNSASALIRMGTTANDIYNGTSRFVASGSNYFQIAYTSNATFNGNIYLNSTSTNGIFFGTSTGTTTISSGYALLTNGFTDGTLSLYNVVQNGSTANGSFVPATFVANGSILRGNFTCTTTGNTTLVNSTFQRTNSFTAAAFATMSGNNFSATSGTTTFTKTGNTNEVWTGGNTFYNTTINNQSSAQYIRLAGTTGDSYLGTTTFAVANAAYMQPSYNSVSTFAGNLYLNCTGTGGYNFGAGAGTTEIASGYAIKTNGYSNAPLTIDELTQFGTANSDSLTVTALSITNSTFGGNLTIKAGTVTFTSNIFSKNNKFYATTFTTVTTNTFSTGSASTTFTKYGSTNDTWVGGNTFGNTTFHNRSNGRLRLANTNPDIHSGTIIIKQDSTGVIDVAYNGNNSFKGNISIIGSTKAVTIGAGTGVVIVEGNTAQSILGNAALTIRRLTMNSSGTIQLLTPVIISTSLTFGNGKIQSDATNLLIINDNVTVTGYGDYSYVNGAIRKIGNDAFVFPTGNASYYAPIGISAPASVTDHFTATYFRNNPHAAGYDTMSIAPTLESVSTREYWMLDRTNGASAVSVTMYWGAHGNRVLDMTALRVARWDGSQWSDHGFSNYIGNETSGNLTSSSSITNFSPFTFGSVAGGGALPVEMTSFTAEVVGENDVELNWTTAVEINNNHYVVERSKDGVTFEAIGSVEGMGNSSVEHNYTFLDKEVAAGLIYYRLKQVDGDGSFEYSAIVAAFVKNAPEAVTTWNMYPNPVQDKLHLSGDSQDPLVTLELLGNDGKTMVMPLGTLGENNSLDVSGLSPGMYTLRIVSQKESSTKKFVKL